MSPPTHNFQDVNWEIFNKDLATYLSRDSPAAPINDHVEFDTKVNTLIEAIQKMIDKTIKWKKLFPHKKRWWIKELTALKKVKNQLSNEAYKYRHIANHLAMERHKTTKFGLRISLHSRSTLPRNM